MKKYATSPKRLYDVIIAGGGMIGSTMACSLGKNPAFNHLKIGLIEAAPKRKYNLQDVPLNRVSSLNPTTKDLLSRLGIWQHIRRSCKVNNMKVWGSYSNDSINFAGSEQEVLAYIVENDEIIHAITKELNKLNNVDVIYDAKIKTVDLNSKERPTMPRLILEDDENYLCKLLVGADGPTSKVRQAMNVNQLRWNYNQCGVVATLQIQNEPKNNTSFQRFLPHGPIALLPLDEDHSSLVWSTTPEKAKSLLQIPPDVFVDAVNDAFNKEPIKNSTIDSLNSLACNLVKILPVSKNYYKSELPKIYNVIESSRALFPLGFAHSSEYTVHNVVIIGDAAHKIHPLAGQGVNLGFRDILILTDVLSKGLQEGRPLGDTQDLRIYEGQSQKSNVPVMAAVDFIHHVYTSNKELVQAFGNFGFRVAEIPGIKSLMKNFAS
ncbi:ubiquinone biosynthesis monooxygenase COQ6, mitochondrial [Cimex lectularius]|uniref:Ubiquinone biosynthesis monooxygenase COQ6, mitochondrial n=1 Tax=Cimex lectularius TaxID=79782 RepID=A0A8I6SQD2_CIMLE|nr:ubiquinone biosynthesis monooxygenase COQ6, mitochondrial [Cimex lectularius]